MRSKQWGGNGGFDDRRRWAIRTLRQHREVDGMCALCVMRFGTQSTWPCAPVRVAEIYTGLAVEAHGSIPSRHRTVADVIRGLRRSRHSIAA